MPPTKKNAGPRSSRSGRFLVIQRLGHRAGRDSIRGYRSALLAAGPKSPAVDSIRLSLGSRSRSRGSRLGRSRCGSRSSIISRSTATAGRGAAARSRRATASRGAIATVATMATVTTPAAVMLVVTTAMATAAGRSRTATTIARRNSTTIAAAAAVMTQASAGLAFSAHQGDPNHREEHRDAEQ